MNELKFNCPACGQRIQADETYQGAQIQCPSCRAAMVVPMPVSAPVERPLPAAGALKKGAVPGPRVSGLAKASLVLSLASVVIGPFGFIPGIVCGHLAKTRVRKNPGLAGQGMATAGLLFGYGFLALSVALLAIVSTMVVKTAARIQQQTRDALTPGAGPGGVLPAATMAKGLSSLSLAEGWKTNLADVSIPDTPVSGRIRGHPFVADRAELSPANSPAFLTLRQGKGLQGDVKITVISGDRQGLEARTLNFSTTAEIPADGDYRVEILRRENGGYVARQFSRIQDGFVMKLECQRRVGDRIKGRIYLCFGDDLQSYLAGTFDAKLQ